MTLQQNLHIPSSRQPKKSDLHYPENGGSKLLSNVVNYLATDMAPYPRKLESASTSLQDPSVSQLTVLYLVS